MPRGQKSIWLTDKSKTVRIPAYLEEEVRAYCRWADLQRFRETVRLLRSEVGEHYAAQVRERAAISRSRSKAIAAAKRKRSSK
jgi:hypothetical protein